MNRIRLSLVLLALAAAGAAGPARAEWVIVPPRPGQVGLSVQPQYGLMLDTGSIGDTYGNGPGLSVQLRYRLRYERAVGLSFEGQRFDARVATTDDTLPNHMNAFLYGVELYQLFGTRTRVTRWIDVGAGLAQFREVLNDTELEFSNNPDGVFVTAGAGVERFVWQSWALDLSGRYYTVFQNGSTNHDFQASIGVVVYATY